MDRSTLHKEMKHRLENAYGQRLRGVVLYGSEARGEATADSDVDVLVLLSGAPSMRDDLDAIDALYPLTLAYGRPLSPKVIDAQEYERRDCPLYRSVHREGVPL